MKNIDSSASRRHWEENLDPRNLGAEAARRDLSREWAFYFSDEARYAASGMPVLSKALCLELGAGLGTYALWLASRGARVVAVDFSAPRLRALMAVARDLGLADRILPLQAAAENLPLAEGVCDAVSTKSVLIHTRLDAALLECRRILRPGGRAVFVEPQGANPFAWMYRITCAPKAWRSITRYFDPECARAVQTVFPHCETRDFYLFGFLSFIWQFGIANLILFRACQALTRWIDRPLLAAIPPLRRLAWFRVFVCTKAQSD